MKTLRISGILIALVIFSLTGQRAEAQSQSPQTDEELEREFQEEERRMMLEQRKKEYDLQLKQMEQEMQMRKMEREMQMKQMEAEADARQYAREQEMLLLRSAGNEEGKYFIPFGGPANQTQLTLRNTFHGGSDTSEGDFEVDEETRFIRCVINGKVREGEIHILVTDPSGDVFKELTISPAAEISYNQSLTIKEGEGKKYFGTWEYEVESDEASGSYMLQISTN